MDFKVTKTSNRITFMIDDDGKPVRRLDVPIDKRLFVKNTPPSKDKLLEIIQLHALQKNLNKNELIDKYINDRNNDICLQTKEMLKCFLRIRNALSCIDLADEIRMADEDEQL